MWQDSPHSPIDLIASTSPVPITTGEMQTVTYNPVNAAVRASAGKFEASKLGMGGAAYGAVAGGVGGWLGSDEGNGGWGAAGGVLAGGLAGSFAASRGINKAIGTKLGNMGLAGKPGAMKAAQFIGSRESRRNSFAAGAFLGGGAFGLMFAGNGKSHRRGFNKTRGNGFTR